MQHARRIEQDLRETDLFIDVEMPVHHAVERRDAILAKARVFLDRQSPVPVVPRDADRRAEQILVIQQIVIIEKVEAFVVPDFVPALIAIDPLGKLASLPQGEIGQVDIERAADGGEAFLAQRAPGNRVADSGFIALRGVRE